VEITQKEYKRVNAVEISGRIDSATAGEFESILVDLAERGRNNIVLDMSAVEFISSAGLRVLVTIRKAVQSAGGDLVLAEPSDRVTDTLEIAGLDVLFSTYPDRESAIASF